MGNEYVVLFSGCGAVISPALLIDGKSIERSETFETITGYLIILVVLTSTLLSLIRLWNWKGRPLEMEATRSAGSSITRSEFVDLELTVKNLTRTERNCSDDSTGDVCWKEQKQLFEPSKQKSQLFGLLFMACLSCSCVLVSIWLGRFCSNTNRIITQDP